MSMRTCPLCGSSSAHLLKRMEFLPDANSVLPDTYDVVNCQDCGFVYDIPRGATADTFQKYYESSSKYIPSGIGGSGDVSPTDRLRYLDILSFCRPALKSRTVSIADVGCGKGGLLRIFKEQGFQNVHGFEPSTRCVELMNHDFGIHATSASISDLNGGERFDLVIVSNVFEHLFSLHDSVERVKSIVAENGYVFVDVPDASRYHEHFYAPFYSFDMEHINHFNVDAMIELWSRHGFQCVQSEEFVGVPVPGRQIPMCRILLKRSASHTHTALGYVNKIQEFITHSTKREMELSVLFPSERPYAIWGLGAYAKWFVRRFPDLNVSAIVDKNAFPHSFGGLPLLKPTDLAAKLPPPTCLLITSVLYAQQIAQDIRNMQWTGGYLTAF